MILFLLESELSPEDGKKLHARELLAITEKPVTPKKPARRVNRTLYWLGREPARDYARLRRLGRD